jgi:hypothetical protein
MQFQFVDLIKWRRGRPQVPASAGRVRRGRVTRSLTPHPASRWCGVTELGVASPELLRTGRLPDRGENPCEVLTDT